jgi:hypothetical protein
MTPATASSPRLKKMARKTNSGKKVTGLLAWLIMLRPITRPTVQTVTASLKTCRFRLKVSKLFLPASGWVAIPYYYHFPSPPATLLIKLREFSN